MIPPRRVVVASVLSLTALLFTSRAFATHTVSDPCWGQNTEIFGTDFADGNVDGNNQQNVIATGSGDDHVESFGSGDRVCLDNDKDFVVGGNGDDRLRGGNGSDVVRGEADEDTVQGGPQVDTVYGGYGNDIELAGGDGNDLVDGVDGSDPFYDGDGDDQLYGGSSIFDRWYPCADSYYDFYSGIETVFTASAAYC